jgi:hypothetical protein
MSRPSSAPIALLLAVGLHACSGGGDDDATATQPPPPPPPPAQGAVTIAVADAPVDFATRVVVEFAGVELKPQGGSPITMASTGRQVDLLLLQRGASTPLVQNVFVPAGVYEWVRLLVNAQPNAQDDSFIELDTGGRFPLAILSGAEPGLQVNRSFTLEAASSVTFTIDFDLRKSLIASQGSSTDYGLRPVLRMVDNRVSGALAGTVSAALAAAPDCTPFIYLYEGSGTVPDDMDSAASPDVDPLTSVPVLLDTPSGQWRYGIGFLEAATYTATFTCDGKSDTPNGEEVLDFTGTQDVAIPATQTATLDFR